MERQKGKLPVIGTLYEFVFGRPGGRRSMLVRIQEVLCTVLFVTMAVVLFLQTIARIFDVSFFWAEELSRYAMVWIIFLGSTVAVYQGSHTNIGVFVEFIPKKVRHYADALVNLASAAVIGTIAWNGIVVFKVAMMGKSSAMEIPLGYVFGVVTFCGSMMAIFFINRAVLKVLGKPLPEDEFTEQQKEEMEL